MLLNANMYYAQTICCCLTGYSQSNNDCDVWRYLGMRESLHWKMQLKLPLSVRAVSVLRLHQKFQLIEVVCFQCLSVLSDLGWLAPASDYKDVDEI